MTASIIEVFKNPNVHLHPDFYVVIEYNHIPEMYSEFATGPPDDDPFPDFWNTAIIVFLFDPHVRTVQEIGFKAMKLLYKYVEGRKDRIEYWRIMKYLEHTEKKNEIHRSTNP